MRRLSGQQLARAPADSGGALREDAAVDAARVCGRSLIHWASMCRNIKTLFNFDPPVTDEEVRAASIQFVRKITGFNKPSKANEGPFLADRKSVV